MALYSAKGDLPAQELLEKLEEGIQLTLKKFVETFEKHDITVVETDEFNPEYHNAVMQVPASDGKEAGQIVEVMQKGYMFKERLLRPAMVSVAN
jgi:molecular chaperone GrpE